MSIFNRQKKMRLTSISPNPEITTYINFEKRKTSTYHFRLRKLMTESLATKILMRENLMTVNAIMGF